MSETIRKVARYGCKFDRAFHGPGTVLDIPRALFDADPTAWADPGQLEAEQQQTTASEEAERQALLDRGQREFEEAQKRRRADQAQYEQQRLQAEAERHKRALASVERKRSA